MIGRLCARLWKSHSAERARKTKKKSVSEKEAAKQRQREIEQVRKAYLFCLDYAIILIDFI